MEFQCILPWILGLLLIKKVCEYNETHLPFALYRLQASDILISNFLIISWEKNHSIEQNCKDENVRSNLSNVSGNFIESFI